MRCEACTFCLGEFCEGEVQIPQHTGGARGAGLDWSLVD